MLASFFSIATGTTAPNERWKDFDFFFVFVLFQICEQVCGAISFRSG
jgi:hypothetical protein